MSMLYLNQAGTSWPKPEPVRAAVARTLASSPDTWADAFAADHAAVCRWLGVADPARLLLTPGATTALNVAVTDHPWESGDRVVISGWEHHALSRPVQQLVHRGVEVIVIPPGDGLAVAPQALEAALERGRVRLVAMTAAGNVTGERLPVRTITGLAREYGALSLIDAAQIAGWLPMDQETQEADLLAFTGHKGPQAPWGIGGLVIAPGVTLASPAAACEVPRDGGGTAQCATLPGYCDVGSVDRAALAGLVAGIEWLDAPKRADRLDVARSRIAAMASALNELPGVRLLGTASPGTRMPTLALTVEGRSPGELAAALGRRDILVAGGTQCAPMAHETLGTGSAGALRISVGPGNASDDVMEAVAALGDILKAGTAG